MTNCNYISYNLYVTTIATLIGVEMQILRIGVREAKIQLSKLLEDVKNGREIIITNHGKPVGKIISIHQNSLTLTERIVQLERDGKIETRGKKKEKGRLPTPLPLPDEIAQRYLQEDRGE